MSVPPVLPLLEKAMPMPLPQKEAPMTQAMKGWSCRRTTPSVSFWIMERKKVRVNTAKIVFTQKIDGEVRILDGKSSGKIYDGCNARYATGSNIVGKQEDCPADTI